MVNGARTATRLCGVFFAGAFFAAVFFAVGAFFATVFVTGGLESAAAPAPTIRNLLRSFAPASHAGAGPRPLQVAPDFGSRYLAGCGPIGCPLLPAAPTAFDAAFLTAAFVVTAASAPSAIRNLVRALTSAI